MVLRGASFGDSLAEVINTDGGRAAMVQLWRVAFDAAADKELASAAFDQEMFHQALRFSIPLQAAGAIRDAIANESLIPKLLRERVNRIFERFCQLVDARPAVTPGDLDVDQVEDGLLTAVHAEFVRCVFRIEEKVQVAKRGLAGDRERRLQAFVLRQRLRDRPVSIAEIGRRAGVHPADMRRWRRGEIPDRSKMARNIERNIAILEN